jgi:hypothetical protein
MKPKVHRTAQLGDLVAAAFDQAAQYGPDPREVPRLATSAVSGTRDGALDRWESEGGIVLEASLCG